MVDANEEPLTPSPYMYTISQIVSLISQYVYSKDVTWQNFNNFVTNNIEYINGSFMITKTTTPPLNGTENIVKWTDMTNKTENGIFYSHGSYLDVGWSNNGWWQIDFDVMAPKWRYVGLMPICSAEINPYTDAKNVNYSMTTWEGFGYPSGLNASVITEDTYSKNTETNTWHHMTIKKLSSTSVEIILDNTYHSIRSVPNLANLTTLYIGTRDNPSGRNYNSIIQYKNIVIKEALYGNTYSTI